MVVPLMAGCDLANRFDAPEDRVNAAVPLEPGVQAAWQQFQAQIKDQTDLQQAVGQRWASRLRMRAVTCMRDFLPGWRVSDAEIRAHLANSECFVDFDRDLDRWIGLQRVQIALSMPPLRSMPQNPPKLVAHREFISSVVQARDAPVALFQGAKGFSLMDLGTGKVILNDTTSVNAYTLTGLSPNGRVIAQRRQDGVLLRLAEGGARLAELPLADGVVWLDSNTLVVRNNDSGGRGMSLLNLGSGESTPMPGGAFKAAHMSAPVPGQASRFNLLSGSGVSQFELSRTDGRSEAQLINEGGTKTNTGFATNTGGLSVDGSKWLDGSGVLRILDMQTLEVRERGFEPARSGVACPTANPDQVIISLARPSGDGVHSLVDFYLYTDSAGTLAKIRKERNASDRYVFVNSIKRLAVIDGHSLRFIDELETEDAQPVDTVLNGFLDEVNQRRLASAFAVGSASQGNGLSGAPGFASGGLPPAAALVQSLRDAQVEGVGVYEGLGAEHGVSKTRMPGTVHVRVRRSGTPLALVLVSYEPVRWRLALDPGARLSAVLLGGYHPSTVEGADAVRVYQIGRVYAYQRPSPEYETLQRTALEWVGKPMSVFQGRYIGATFMVGGS